MRIITSGLIATYPLGGVAWDYAQYAAGLQRLGHDVLYLEDTGHWLYDAVNQTYTDDASRNVEYLAGVMRLFGLGDHWSLRDPKDRYWGRNETEVADWCAGADLVLNISGSLWPRDAYQKARCKVYLDSDPAYTQAKIRRVLDGQPGPNEAYSLECMRLHDRFFTFGENIGQPDCPIPTDEFQWRPTRQPILLDEWKNPKSKIQNPKSPWTTVMSWKIDERPPEIAGCVLGAKDREFEKFMELPRKAGVPLELAVSGRAPREALAVNGWRLVDGYAVSSDAEVYRDYILCSRGEWSVAKQAYVATRSGWFSCRTACYLAAGKPAVVQDTGWSKFYPSGRGLLAFATLDEAAAAIASVERDYAAHCRAAREVAAECFDAGKVLKKLLADC
jgi:hypothetical protein